MAEELVWCLHNYPNKDKCLRCQLDEANCRLAILRKRLRELEDKEKTREKEDRQQGT